MRGHQNRLACVSRRKAGTPRPHVARTPSNAVVSVRRHCGFVTNPPAAPSPARQHIEDPDAVTSRRSTGRIWSTLHGRMDPSPLSPRSAAPGDGASHSNIDHQMPPGEETSSAPVLPESWTSSSPWRGVAHGQTSEAAWTRSQGPWQDQVSPRGTCADSPLNPGQTPGKPGHHVITGMS